MKTDRLNELTVNNEGFAFDSRTGNTYNINATGLVAMNGMKAGKTNAQIIDQLEERFDVDRPTASRDLELFLNQLERNNLIEAEVLS